MNAPTPPDGYYFIADNEPAKEGDVYGWLPDTNGINPVGKWGYLSIGKTLSESREYWTREETEEFNGFIARPIPATAPREQAIRDATPEENKAADEAFRQEVFVSAPSEQAGLTEEEIDALERSQMGAKERVRLFAQARRTAGLERENLQLKSDPTFVVQAAYKLGEDAAHATLTAQLATAVHTEAELRESLRQCRQELNDLGEATELRAQLAQARVQLAEDRKDFLDINEYWNGGNGSACDAALHACEISESAMKRLGSTTNPTTLVAVERSELIMLRASFEGAMAYVEDIGLDENMKQAKLNNLKKLESLRSAKGAA